MNRKLTIGASLSLSGSYAAMGRQAEAGMRLFVADLNAGGGLALGGDHYELALDCHDDRSDRARCAEIYRSLCFENRADLIFGPYSSRLVRIAAPIAEQAGLVMVNHGGAADDLYEHKLRMIVGVLSPASEYFKSFARLISAMKFFRKRVAIVAARNTFAREVAAGFENACNERYAWRRGVRVRVKFNGNVEPADPPAHLMAAIARNRVNILVSAGSFGHDVKVMRTIVAGALNIPVLACVAAGVVGFGAELGEHAEGIVGPSQWEEEAEIDPEIGLAPAEFGRRMRELHSGADCDYPAAQAYAAGLLTVAALRAAAGTLDQNRLRAAFSDLRTTTLFGGFAIDRVTGRQLSHRLMLVQWHRGKKVIIEPEPRDDSGAIEFPSGWRLLVSSFQIFKLSRGKQAPPDEQD
ncbi:MAG TPA: ABC transporter substrate-binding protein [Candidatus Binataceae bacterium]|nr:ABC transporter substrate-binding protein [Candidatus Binataceae bacterium]